MSRAASWAVALVGLALLTFFCVRCHGPVIEADLAASTSAALGGDALDNVEVAVAGRDVVLTGRVDSEADRERFGALAARVRGVRAVDNRLRLPGEPDPDAADPTADDLSAAPTFALVDGPDGLVVRGTVADDAARAALLARVAEAFPGRPVTDDLTVDTEAGAAWRPAVDGVLGALGGLPSGTLADGGLSVEPGDGPDGGVLVLSGRVPDDAAKAQAEAAAQASVDAPWTLRSALTVGDAASAAAADSAGTQIETAAPGNADVAAVQTALQEIFAVGAIEFETGTTRLTGPSLDLLDKASGVLRRFDDVTVEVQGHTDDEGSAASNLRLSEQRADAVRRYLSEAGVARTRLTVRGFGEAEPLASNDTPEGRARNRRVVFRLDAE